MKKLTTIISVFIICVLSSCAIYNNPVVFNVDKEHRVSKPLDTASKVVITNDHSKTIVTTNNYHPQTVKSEPIKTNNPQIITKVVTVGCKAFVKPKFKPVKKLTIDSLKEKNPKNTKEINNLLLDNIRDNYRIVLENNSLLEKAIEDHLSTCQ